MNISPNCPRPDFLFAGFNQDCGCFVVGSKTGIKFFNTDPFLAREHLYPEHNVDYKEEVPGGDHPNQIGCGVRCAEMLFVCNYVAYVSTERTNRVNIWDDAKKKNVIELDFDSDVRGIRLRRDRIVVVLNESVEVYTFTSTPNHLHSFTTFKNPRGICSLSPSSSNSLLAFPSTDVGKVEMINLADMDRSPDYIQAHETNIACLTINIQGTRLATASDKGTLIRLFNTETLQLITELRRGSQPASIYCINFSQDSSLLCASSSHGTIHVFSLDDRSRKNRQPAAFLLASTTTKLLPKYFSSEWAFTRIEVPGGAPSICAFGKSNNVLVAVCSDGSYHRFVIEDGETYTKDAYHLIFE